MNRTELVRAVAQRSGVSQANTSRVLSCFEDVLKISLSCDEDVVIPGFGVFQVKTRKVRKVLRGVEYSSLRRIASFRPARPFKDRINVNLQEAGHAEG